MYNRGMASEQIESQYFPTFSRWANYANSLIRPVLRWRPKFSVRTLVVAVTLLCCYAACWGPTQSRGITDVENHVFWGGQSPRGQARVYGVNTSSSLPLIVATDVSSDPPGKDVRAYYLWLFGFVVKMPFEHGFPDDELHWGYVMKILAIRRKVKSSLDLESQIRWTATDGRTKRSVRSNSHQLILAFRPQRG